MNENKETNKEEKGFFRKHLFDFVSLIGLVGITAGAFVIKANMQKAPLEGEALIANITREGKLIATYDLSLYGENEVHETIQGKYTTLTIGMKHNAIHVEEAGCPGQECVHEGWVTTCNHPIICAYNAVYIDVISSDGGSIIIG